MQHLNKLLPNSLADSLAHRSS